MATPYVTGVAALLKAAEPMRDWRAIRNLILAGGESLPAFRDTITGRRLSAYGSLTCRDSVVRSRLAPQLNAVNGFVGSSLELAVLHNGPVDLMANPGGQGATLRDDGQAPSRGPATACTPAGGRRSSMVCTR